MILNIIFGILIFGYAGWALFRYIKKSKQGKCASCSLAKNCESSCDATSILNSEISNEREGKLH